MILEEFEKLSIVVKLYPESNHSGWLIVYEDIDSYPEMYCLSLRDEVSNDSIRDNQINLSSVEDEDD